MSDRWSHSFHDVLKNELDKVGDELPVRPDDPIAEAHAKQLVGLAFSGGGIRSATFNLGVLQSLARLNILSKVDYLSTVSGGGYIGSWLMAFLKQRGMKDVLAALTPERKQHPGNEEPDEIRFLRRFSNYLTPKLGWLGADMWTVIAVYLRNLILNLLVLASAFAVALLIPRGVAVSANWLWRTIPVTILGAIAAMGLCFAAYSIMRSMRYFGPLDQRQPKKREIISLPEDGDSWTDAAGQSVQISQTNAPAAWYRDAVWHDLILRADFELPGPAHGYVYVWTTFESPNASGAPQLDSSVAIEVGCSGTNRAVTGTINGQRPARPAAITPGINKLEITCVDDRCTVAVNAETINTLRLNRPRSPGRWRFSPARPQAGAIGLKGGGVTFSNLAVEKVQTAWETGHTQGQIQRWIITPLFVAAFLATFLFGFGDYTGSLVGTTDAEILRPASMRQWLGLPPILNGWSWWGAALVTGVMSAAIVLVGQLWAGRASNEKLRARLRPIWPFVANIFFAAAAGGALAWALYGRFKGRTAWEVLTWGPPAVIGVFLLTTVLFIGLLGRLLPDQRREWWSRLGAWLLIYALAWGFIFALAFYAPALVRVSVAAAPYWSGLLSATWIVSTVSGLIAGRSAATGREKTSGKLVELLAKVTPYIFIAGFLILLSFALDALISPRSVHLLPGELLWYDALDEQWRALDNAQVYRLILTALAAAAIAAVLSWRLDINQFSMHLLYRNRLGRCYLGASNRVRRAQPFTGFSADDDVQLSELDELFKERRAAPYPILNAALNLVGGKELAWQQRKAASFVFTPGYCGYDFPDLPPGYCETKKFASKSSPITLATAMAISGAAASPNMGYHTSPAPAFLMTVFNVRLGWWLGNPRRQEAYERSGPLNVLSSLLSELFGLTSEQGKYVYLSDGGHFENLGIYELVRRRCRFIISCDAEEDRAFGFGGLGNAIEKCRSDFGIDIDIDMEPIRRRADDGYSEWHCAIGTIHYSRVDEGARDGILVYLKSSLTGDEPSDALRYAAAVPDFPHQSTGDQWFDESQFESYRVLGFHIAENVFGAAGKATKVRAMTKEELFVALDQAWYPPSAANAEAFTKHTRTAAAINDQLRGNKSLSFLSEQIYPEWRILFEPKGGFPPGTSAFALDPDKPLRDQLPEDETQRHAGFYLCNSVLQLLEDVYVDLKLEEQYDHPDNRGWMNYFKHWSWAPMFRVTWSISASNYGARFQKFCERHLGLGIGGVRLRRLTLGSVQTAARGERFLRRAKVFSLAKEIADAIWMWLDELPVGSEVIAKAAQVAADVPGYIPSSAARSCEEKRHALEKAEELIGRALRSRRTAPIGSRSPSRDEEWHAGATLLELCYSDVADDQRMKWADTVVEVALIHAQAIDQRLSAPEMEDQLNPVERGIIRSFFIFNPSVAASASILRLEITPDANAGKRSAGEWNLHFPFGFAVLAKPARQGAGAAGGEALVYFRVQDHLRKMGLAREALERMIIELTNLTLDAKKMHPRACEVPTEKDRERFVRLFNSAQIAVEQERRARPAEMLRKSDRM